MHLPLGATASILLTLALAGCSSSRTAKELPTEPEAREQALSESLALRDPRMGAEKGAAFLEVTVTNPSDSRVAVRCAPEWYDAQGRVVANASAWQMVELDAGAERRLRFSPAPADARSWRMRFTP